MINYGTLDQREVDRQARYERKLRYLMARTERLKQLGLCIACGKVPVSRFSKCLNCRLGRKTPA